MGVALTVVPAAMASALTFGPACPVAEPVAKSVPMAVRAVGASASTYLWTTTTVGGVEEHAQSGNAPAALVNASV
ncbi:hypothetical protein CBR_g2976 [Chara braunii]|uniref:Uncharacterized protein n=1 Tax=Chara braunii TaxID=69332 RepID=A0A388KEE3_CHABU|nr:hypothetical protein CBR_g2976 [Chara braunii]|eukprot:GBG68432.1 hypothetical protein CBR_g2976 [Chara braunii]